MRLVEFDELETEEIDTVERNRRCCCFGDDDDDDDDDIDLNSLPNANGASSSVTNTKSGNVVDAIFMSQDRLEKVQK